MASIEDKRNSPFNSFLIDDPTPNNSRITITNEESPTICISCQQDLRLCSSKILACLHSVCMQCLDKVKDSLGTIYTCSACSHKSRSDTICDNLFATEETDTNGLSPHCSNCEEGNMADWYCNNCADWLCTQCKNAHSRVRITKDHIVTQKSAEEARQIRGIPSNTDKLLCQIHKEELARNFCQDCQILTCDECQITLHKNHRYLFIDEALLNQKTNLQSLVTKVRDIRLMLNKIQTTRNQQKSDIDQTEHQVIDDIKLFGINMIAEISKACKQLINDTSTICDQARTQFTEKNTRFEQYLQNIDHSLDFVSEALTTGSKTALLTSNRVMSKRLDHLLHQNAIWSKPVNPFQLTFSPYDPKNIRSTITSLGTLVQNGKKKINNNRSIFMEEQTNGIDQRKLNKYTSQLTTTDKSEHDIQPAILLDTSDDFCAVCRCGGELVCCDECPRVYHVDCHVPSLNEVSMNDKWKCGLCCEINNSTGPLKRKHDDTTDKLPSVEKQICEKLILQMYTHPSSAPFHQPVPADCIGYHKIITRPMDLRTIKEKIKSYGNMSEFLADVRLMFQNCSTFNRPESEIGKSGRTLSKAFEEWLEKYYLNSQIPIPDRTNKRKKTSIQMIDHVS
ncbi:unnamed protein product [Adineta steineri]|uniref:Uncharacterized protein n=1 Tax=Adineta steineri TaxID=433720 RepID=A0A815DTS8_9BILA|nr:unnamed protein product [Adineta steineri]CAF3882340.1 unnamed protein product [Adineta steineri]